MGNMAHVRQGLIPVQAGGVGLSCCLMLQGAADEMLPLASRHLFKYRETVSTH